MTWEGVSPELREIIEEVCTPKQIDVLKLKARGLSPRAIARILDVDRTAVRGRLDRAYRKIQARLDDAGLPR